MRIGELARRTGVAPRLLRYYEQQGLIVSKRAENGYRDYDEDAVGQVARVAGLVRSGIPTRLVRAILTLEGIEAVEMAATCSRTLAEELASELNTIEERIACLTKSRDSIRGFLSKTQHGSVLEQTP